MGIAYLTKVEATHVISGMALGWDTALCIAALDLSLPLTAAVPFQGQESRWPTESKKLYHRLSGQCEQVAIISKGGYSAAAMQKRNEWMVDRCDRLVALWDGSSGGTANCIRYATRVGRPYDNLYESWRKYCRPSPSSDALYV